MPNPVSPRRRQWLRHAAGVSAAPGLLGLTACQGGHPADRALTWPTLSQAEVELDRLAAAVALARLKSAMSAFQRWPGPLKPHFAYGALDHADDTRAHAIHLADHLSQFDARA